MRVEGLHHRELLALDPQGGVIRFAGQHAVLREYLIHPLNQIAWALATWHDHRFQPPELAGMVLKRAC